MSCTEKIDINYPANLFVEKDIVYDESSGSINCSCALENKRAWFIGSFLSTSDFNVFQDLNNPQKLALYTWTNNKWHRELISDKKINNLKGVALYLSDTSTLELSGKINNSDYSIDLTSGYNLISNPYPCTIDWSLNKGFIRPDLDGTIYVRTTLKNGNRGYSTYLLNAIDGNKSINGGTKYISPLQSFWVICEKESQFSINRQARTLNNKEQLKSMEEISPSDFRMKLRTMQSDDESLIYFSDNATIDKEKLDSKKMWMSNNYTHPEICTQINGFEYSINALPKNFSELNVVIKMKSHGYKGIAWIETPEIQNFDPGINILLLNTSTNKIVDLKRNNPIKIKIDTEINTDYQLIFKQISTSSKNNSENNDIIIRIENGHIQLRNYYNKKGVIADHFSIYNLKGQKVFSANLYEEGYYDGYHCFYPGIYLIQITYKSGDVKTKKFFIGNEKKI